MEERKGGNRIRSLTAIEAVSRGSRHNLKLTYKRLRRRGIKNTIRNHENKTNKLFPKYQKEKKKKTQRTQ